MEIRRAANEELRDLKGVISNANADEVESRMKGRLIVLRRSSFKKIPDASLGEVVARKLRYRSRQARGRKSR